MRFEPSGSKGSETDIHVLVGSLFAKYERQVFQLAWKVTKSTELSRDIVQEVFLKVWEHRDELHDIRVMEAWLHRIVKNKLIDFLRKTAADSQLRAQLWQRMQSSQPNSFEELEKKETNTMINESVEALPEQRRLVFRLNREGGLSYQEIANELSISPHTVKNQLFLALKSLQKKFSLQ